MAHSLLRKGIFVLLLIMLFVTLISVTVIASMPVESFPIKGTFNYSIWVVPSLEPYTFNFSYVRFTYGSYLDVTSPFYQVPYDRLRVFPESLQDDTLGWGNGSPLAEDNNFHVVIAYSWQNTRNGSVPLSGTYWVADSRGITPPVGLSTQFGSTLVDLNDIISISKVVNDTLTLEWSLDFGTLVATFDSHPPSQGFIKSAWIYCSPQPCYGLDVKIVNGTPYGVTLDNETTGISVNLGGDLNGSECRYSDSLDILNPTVLQAKQSLPSLLTASIILAIAIPIAQYYFSKPKEPTNQSSDNNKLNSE
ncbi:MAG: hypothetical protein ABSG57_01595 [Candidatus Bathyarchaeia archaeon]